MSKAKLNFRNLSVPDKITRARQIISAMTGNKSFPNPTPPLEDLTKLVDETETLYADALAKRAASKQATTLIEEKVDELGEQMSFLVNYVNSASGGKESVVESAGLDVAGKSTNAPQTPAPPTTLTPTMGDQEGEIDLSWNASPGAKSYIVELTQTPADEATWKQQAVVTASKCTVGKLTSGTKYWFRVRAVGAAGHSAWSDPASKMAP